jgi:hypothetical protein
VRQADAVVWFGTNDTRGGRLTLGLARIVGIPTFIVGRADDDQATQSPERFVVWLRDHPVRTLLVAGNRESHEPGIGAWVEGYLLRAFAKLTAAAEE